MNKLKKTVHGILNMPKASAFILAKCLRLSCLFVAAAILLSVAAQSSTYSPFELLGKADLLMRISPAVLAYGVAKSLSCAVQYKK